MTLSLQSRRWLGLTLAGLAVQLVLLWISLSYDITLSVFCTGADSAWLRALGYVHALYLVLLVVGVATLRVARLRPWYLALLLLALPALPVQAHFVRTGAIYCSAF